MDSGLALAAGLGSLGLKIANKTVLVGSDMEAVREAADKLRED